MSVPNAALSAASTDSTAAAVVTTVERICLPLIGGQGIQTVASTTGLNRRDGDWIVRISDRSQIRISPPGRANPTICTGEVVYPQGGEGPILEALDAWAAARSPAMTKSKSRAETRSGDLQYRASAWFGPSPTGTTAVVFTEQKELDGRPLEGDRDRAMLVVSVTPQ
jgi:hypothetical protein